MSHLGDFLVRLVFIQILEFLVRYAVLALLLLLNGFFGLVFYWLYL